MSRLNRIRTDQDTRLGLTLEEHGVDDHGSIWVLHILGDLGQLAVRGLGCPLIDGVDGAPLVPEVYLRVVVVVVLLAAFHKVVSEGDGAGAVQAVVDLPGSVAFLGIAQLKRRNVWSVTNERGIVGNVWSFGIFQLCKSQG